jgi:Zn-dependent peptidase ImmA (M78 family)
MSAMEGVDPKRDAEEVLRTYWAKEDGSVPVPVDPIAIARKLGFKIYTATLDPNVAGMLVMNPGQDPEIYLNGGDSYNRQRFTCAHELGHWAKHVAAGVDSGRVVDYRDSLASEGTDPEEIYANQFAATLLMPEQTVRQLADHGYGPVALADTLRVSADAASFRLKNLKLT